MGSFGRFVVLMALLTIFSCIQSSNAAVCPPPAWIKSTRVCLSDKECYPALCCPNYLGRKSCANSQTTAHGHGSYKNEASGVNCVGVTCMPYEVCKPDPITKRLRCQRR